MYSDVNWPWVNWSKRKSNPRLAVELGVHPATVAKWRKRLGKPCFEQPARRLKVSKLKPRKAKTRKPKTRKDARLDWRTANWKQQDCVLAAKYRIRADSVAETRKRYHRPKAHKHGQPRSTEHLEKLRDNAINKGAAEQTLKWTGGDLAAAERYIGGTPERLKMLREIHQKMQATEPA